MNSLQKKLLFIIISVSFIVAHIATAFLYMYESRRSQYQAEITLNQLLDTVAGTASIAAYSKNKEIAEDVLQGLLKNDAINSVRLNVIGEWTIERSKMKAVDPYMSISRSLVSPFNQYELVGVLSAYSTEEYVKKSARTGLINNVYLSVSLILITAWLIYILIKQYFSKPLSLVSTTLHSIKTGEQQRLPMLSGNKNDELGQLVVDINGLLNKLEMDFKNEAKLRQQIEKVERELREIYNSASAGLFLIDENGYPLSHNPVLLDILNLHTEKQQQLFSLHTVADYFNEVDEFQLMCQRIIESGQLESRDFSLKMLKDNKPVWLHILLSRIDSESSNAGLEGVVFDVTDRVEQEQANRHIADHDELTGLFRKQTARGFFNRLRSGYDENISCFLMMDLDGFKAVNDEYGHHVGDRVLQVVAERMLNCVRSSDVVARLGGDEFLVILNHHFDQGLQFVVAEKIIHAIQKPIRVETQIIEIGVSIGLENTLEKEADFDMILESADQAMYQVKKQGKNGYCYRNQHNDFEVRLF